jgi:hypothetical protein
MPAGLIVQQLPDGFSIAYDLSSMQNVKIMVDEKLKLGVKDELRVYESGTPRPESASTVSYGSLQVIPSSRKWTQLWDSRVGVPLPGKRYTVEDDISLFETDAPPRQWMDPKTGESHRTLWKKTIR